jgi:hypothetical protein
MKLWLLRPVDCLKEEGNPWCPWYDKAFGFVVRAETEEEARAMADRNAGDENHEISYLIKPWIDARYSSCVELTPEGGQGLVMRDFQGA